MDLKDFNISQEDLVKDDLYGYTLPKNNSCKVVGQHGKSRSNKYYYVKCNTCAADPELYGDGIFRIVKTNLMSGRVPCGCSGKHVRSEAQILLMVERSLASTGQIFKGWIGEFTGTDSRCVIECPDHGQYNSAQVSSFARLNNGCRQCFYERLKIDEEEWTEAFMSSGSFKAGTRFWRSDNKNASGWKTNFFIECGACKEVYERTSSALKEGNVPCSCGPNKQNFAYINLLSDGSVPIAIKFGISSKPDVRLAQQNIQCIFDMTEFAHWKFDETTKCREAETLCKNLLQTKVLSREEMPDGWTETTYISNIDKIIEIYESLGGVRG